MLHLKKKKILCLQGCDKAPQLSFLGSHCCSAFILIALQAKCPGDCFDWSKHAEWKYPDMNPEQVTLLLQHKLLH